MGPCYGTLVRSVLWAPVVYMVYDWYILGCKLAAHIRALRKTLGEVASVTVANILVPASLCRQVASYASKLYPKMILAQTC